MTHRIPLRRGTLHGLSALPAVPTLPPLAPNRPTAWVAGHAAACSADAMTRLARNACDRWGRRIHANGIHFD